MEPIRTVLKIFKDAIQHIHVVDNVSYIQPEDTSYSLTASSGHYLHTDNIGIEYRPSTLSTASFDSSRRGNCHKQQPTRDELTNHIASLNAGMMVNKRLKSTVKLSFLIVMLPERNCEAYARVFSLLRMLTIRRAEYLNASFYKIYYR